MKKIIIFSLLLALFSSTSCSQDENLENMPLESCLPETEWRFNIDNMETTLMSKLSVWEEDYQDKSSYMGIGEDGVQLTYESGAFKYFYRICNFPEILKNKEIPKKGLKVVLTGEVYSYFGTIPIAPANCVYYDLELTNFKIEKL